MSSHSKLLQKPLRDSILLVGFTALNRDYQALLIPPFSATTDNFIDLLGSAGLLFTIAFWLFI